MYIPCIFSSTHYDDAQLSLTERKNVSSGMRLSFPPLLQAVCPVLACLSDNKHFCGNRRVQNINKGPLEVAGGGEGWDGGGNNTQQMEARVGEDSGKQRNEQPKIPCHLL